MSTTEQGAGETEPAGTVAPGHDRELVRALIEVARDADEPLSQAEIDAALGVPGEDDGRGDAGTRATQG